LGIPLNCPELKRKLVCTYVRNYQGVGIICENLMVRGMGGENAIHMV